MVAGKSSFKAEHPLGTDHPNPNPTSACSAPPCVVERGVERTVAGSPNSCASHRIRLPPLHRVARNGIPPFTPWLLNRRLEPTRYMRTHSARRVRGAWNGCSPALKTKSIADLALPAHCALALRGGGYEVWRAPAPLARLSLAALAGSTLVNPILMLPEQRQPSVGD